MMQVTCDNHVSLEGKREKKRLSKNGWEKVL